MSLGVHRSSDARQLVAFRPVSAKAASEGSQFLRRLQGLTPRPLKDLVVAQQIGNSKSRHAPLPCSKKFAGPAQFEIHLGNLETILGLSENAQAFISRFGSGFTGEKQAIGFACASANAPTQLVQLRQAEV